MITFIYNMSAQPPMWCGQLQQIVMWAIWNPIHRMKN